jgi:hypothetical protein
MAGIADILGALGITNPTQFAIDTYSTLMDTYRRGQPVSEQQILEAVGDEISSYPGYITRIKINDARIQDINNGREQSTEAATKLLIEETARMKVTLAFFCTDGVLQTKISDGPPPVYAKSKALEAFEHKYNVRLKTGHARSFGLQRDSSLALIRWSAAERKTYADKIEAERVHAEEVKKIEAIAAETARINSQGVAPSMGEAVDKVGQTLDTGADGAGALYSGAVDKLPDGFIKKGFQAVGGLVGGAKDLVTSFFKASNNDPEGRSGLAIVYAGVAALAARWATNWATGDKIWGAGALAALVAFLSVYPMIDKGMAPVRASSPVSVNARANVNPNAGGSASPFPTIGEQLPIPQIPTI